MSTDEIDTLLERYLQLLDEYTSLRTELSTLQSSIHQDIARANFSSDRGIRYGQDYYDSRMHASRTVELVPSEAEPTILHFAVKEGPIKLTEGEKAETLEVEVLPRAPKNPLNMFGILVPQPLRSAQAHSITMVEQVIPQLATIDAEMRELEIRIRRARKHHKRGHAQKKPIKDMTALEAMATRDGPPPPGVLREGPAPPYLEVRFAEEWE